MIAAGSYLDDDYLRVGKVFSITSYLLCAVLLYVFTQRLWHSQLAASLAVLLFSLARGIAAVAVEMAVPDFLFAALALAYFILLLKCLRSDTSVPWLAVCTAVALLLTHHGKQRMQRLALAAILPVLVAAGWAGVLHSKYGVYTTGTQFKANFLQWTAHAYDDRSHEAYAVLKDTRPFIDLYNVDDPTPPGSWLWHYHLPARRALQGLASGEIHNLPRAAKGLFILVTPGGIFAFAYVVIVLIRKRASAPVEFAVAGVALVELLGLLLAYCMLVFDGRYLYPVMPLIMAVAAGFVVLEAGSSAKAPRAAVFTLMAAGAVFSIFYSSSPFRTLRRDFQISCYRAGAILRSHNGSEVVSIGSGPYPEHGVGWEAGYKSAFFGNCRLIGVTDHLPTTDQMQPLLQDIATAAPDVVLVWGRSGDSAQEALIQRILAGGPQRFREEIVDPVEGPVGSAVFLVRSSGLDAGHL